MNGIEVNNITKRFGDTLALNQVSLKFEPNKIYGLLGRNGAGKSTLLNIITNRLFPDEGDIKIEGLASAENDEAQNKVYLMSEKNLYPDSMSCREVFKWSRMFYPNFDLEYAMELAKQFGLDINKKIKTLSTGFSSIFKIVIALSVNTPYVLFDEPILGLDANHREMFYKLLIKKYSLSPFTAIISTHLIEEVAMMLENVMIIKNGELLINESCETLLKSGYSVSGTAKQIDAFIMGKEVISIDALGGLKTATIIGAVDKNTIPLGLEMTGLDLQKFFIKLTNEE
ncbi:ABC transporter ATP-binding protein [Acetobacterium tundrae]|uniref:ATP-binding cassette domain-containing protein n=1 Tax=Acetobacterium tundrae TaxID=132932 RepID=A0ABR6WHE0_9FIRM|nr:ABC transporter ATP-binding protein [Acetobacterium tundrae]MBC3795863.1 ATP-binding cassette domain-containing protein [Acetobacterium tundrae]